MKRLISILFCICMFLPLFGCAQEETIQKPVTFYYRRSEVAYGESDGVIATEQRESLGHEGDILYLLSQYLSGPQSGKLAQTFPDDLVIVSLHYENNLAKIIFSYHLAELSGLDLTIACACVTKTVIELTGVEAVQMSAAGELLNEYQSITMDSDCLLLLDTVHKQNNSH